MSTPGCPTLDTAPTVHHPVTAANKKPAENPGRFNPPGCRCGCRAVFVAAALPPAVTERLSATGDGPAREQQAQ